MGYALLIVTARPNMLLTQTKTTSLSSQVDAKKAFAQKYLLGRLSLFQVIFAIKQDDSAQIIWAESPRSI